MHCFGRNQESLVLPQMKYGLAQIILPQIENCLVVGKQEIVVNSNTFNKALYGSKSAQMVQPQ